MDWLHTLPEPARIKCYARLSRLAELGHELRRPEADFLRDGIYELRASVRGLQYRILYFFHGQNVVVVSHGIIKEAAVPPREIDRAVRAREEYVTNPEAHQAEARLR